VRVDAVLVTAIAVASSVLLLALYARLTAAYVLAADCYARALQVARDAAQALAAGLRPSPPQGWQVEVVYANGTALRYGSLARERCRAYAIAGDGALVIARG